MILPDQLVVIVYGKFAWGIVLASILTNALDNLNRGDRRLLLVVIMLSMGSMWLPGVASPSHWLGLAFQSPSGLLAGYCGFTLRRRLFDGIEAAGLPTTVAQCLALLGAILYADALGFLTVNLYALGFDPIWSPLFALSLSVIAVAVLWRRGGATIGWAVLFAIALFQVGRLPTGNLFDVVLDPMIWVWSLWRALTSTLKQVKLWLLGFRAK